MRLHLYRSYSIGAILRPFCLLLCLLGGGTAARAASYYWVGNSGTWTDMSHWASTSGGAGNAYANVPKSMDNVYFDANSFTAANQLVTIVGTVTCNNMTWSGNVRQATFLQGASGVLEINGDLHYTPTMATATAIGVPHRLLAAATGAVVDMQGVPFSTSLLFDNASGGWTFTSTFNGTAGATVNISAARLVSFGSATLTMSTLSTYTGSTAVASTVAGTLDLGSSTTTLLAQASPGTLSLTNLNLTLKAGTSTLNVGAGALTNYTTPVSFTAAKALAFNTVVINTGNGAVFNVANSSFNTLTVNSRLTLSSAATIGAAGSLTLGPSAALLVGAGAAKVLSFGAGATLATNGSCAGFGTVQSTLAGSPAFLARSGGWASAPLSYAALQDLTFTDGSSGYPANGAAQATASANLGGNSGITITNVPVADLYWVGGSGSWHDANHWASTSGGSGSAGNTCVPNVFTNVHFDANSFPTTGGVVTLDLTGQECRDMDWTGVTNKPTLTAASRCLLTVAGSLTLVGPASMTQTLAATDLFLGQPGGGSYTLTTAGQSLAANLWFRPVGGTYALLDDLTTSGRVYVESGTFTTNDRTINAQSFSSGYAFNNSVYSTGTGFSSPISVASLTVNLGASVLNLLGTSNRNDSNTSSTTYAWDIASVTVGNVTTTPVTLNAGSSTINMLNGNNTALYNSLFRGSLGLTYSTVNFANNTSGGSASLMGTANTTSTFQNLRFYGLATISSNNTITGRMLLSPGKTYFFTNAITQTFASGATLDAQGTCANLITMTGPSNAAATRFVSASNLPLQYVTLQYTAFSGGAAWQDSNGLDNGTNTGIAITAPPTRTLYWVGNSGSWSDATHWSLSSGGSGGQCTPSLVDNVVVDANSFTSSGQTLTVDLMSSNCRSIDCRAATNGMTLRSLAGNQLSVYGSVTWAAAPSMTLALAGGLSILGPNTTSTITSAGQKLTSVFTINTPGGSVTLADGFTNSTGIVHTAGTLATNDQPVTALNYITSTAAVKVLSLGASRLIINGIWSVGTGTSLTVVPGTSLVTINSTSFTGGSQPFYDLVLNSPATSSSLAGNNTFHDLRLTGSTNIQGSNTITGTLTFSPGRAYVFATGTITTFGPAASLSSVGLSNNPVTLQSSVNGSLFTWTKATGGICADYTYIRDSKAMGGAYFEAGRNGANNQGNNPGWSFGFVPRASYTDRTTCPFEGPHALRIDFTAYDGTNDIGGLALATAQFPLTVRVHNLTANTYEDVSAPATPYYYPIPSSSTTTQYQVTAVSTSATSGCGASSTTDLSTFPIVTDAILAGPTATWSGNNAPADGSWLDCHNWASGTLPDANTDVTLVPNATVVSLGNGLTATVAVQPTVNGPGAAVHTLSIPAGTTLTLGSSGQLAVAGDWVNAGTVLPDPASQVTFLGSSPQTLTAGNFGSVVVNNPAGLTLATDASTSGSLVLTAGTVTTGASKWVHNNGSATSLSGYSASSYVVGTLRRAIAPNVAGTYAFPVGTASQYALYELLDHNLRGAGFGTIDAQFGPKPGNDANLNYHEPGQSTLYRTIHSAGVWTLTPSAQPSAGTYDAKLSLLPFSNLIDNFFAVLKRPDASTDAADWTGGGGTLNANGGAGRMLADGYALRLGLSSFSQFGLGQTEGASPLPVTLVSFRATASGTCGVRLDWLTASEIKSDRFEIERSTDGRSFVKIATVATRNSATGGTYAYTDQYPGEGMNYYRLKLIDLDQTSTYSPVVTRAVACEGATAVRLVPNPATSTVRLLGLPAGQTIQVYSSDGRLVYSQPAAETDQALEIGSWVTGLYLVHIRTAEGVLTGTYKLLKD